MPSTSGSIADVANAGGADVGGSVGGGVGLVGFGVGGTGGVGGAGVGLVWKASVASSAMLRSRAYTRASRSAPQRWLQVPAVQDVQPSVASVYFHSARKNWGRKCEQKTERDNKKKIRRYGVRLRRSL